MATKEKGIPSFCECVIVYDEDTTICRHPDMETRGYQI